MNRLKKLCITLATGLSLFATYNLSYSMDLGDKNLSDKNGFVSKEKQEKKIKKNKSKKSNLKKDRIIEKNQEQTGEEKLSFFIDNCNSDVSHILSYYVFKEMFKGSSEENSIQEERIEAEELGDGKFKFSSVKKIYNILEYVKSKMKTILDVDNYIIESHFKETIKRDFQDSSEFNNLALFFKDLLLKMKVRCARLVKLKKVIFGNDQKSAEEKLEEIKKTAIENIKKHPSLDEQKKQSTINRFNNLNLNTFKKELQEAFINMSFKIVQGDKNDKSNIGGTIIRKNVEYPIAAYNVGIVYNNRNNFVNYVFSKIYKDILMQCAKDSEVKSYFNYLVFDETFGGIKMKVYVPGVDYIKLRKETTFDTVKNKIEGVHFTSKSELYEIKTLFKIADVYKRAWELTKDFIRNKLDDEQIVKFCKDGISEGGISAANFRYEFFQNSKFIVSMENIYEYIASSIYDGVEKDIFVKKEVNNKINEDILDEIIKAQGIRIDSKNSKKSNENKNFRIYKNFIDLGTRVYEDCLNFGDFTNFEEKPKENSKQISDEKDNIFKRNINEDISSKNLKNMHNLDFMNKECDIMLYLFYNRIYDKLNFFEDGLFDEQDPEQTQKIEFRYKMLIDLFKYIFYSLLDEDGKDIYKYGWLPPLGKFWPIHLYNNNSLNFYYDFVSYCPINSEEEGYYENLGWFEGANKNFENFNKHFEKTKRFINSLISKEDKFEKIYFDFDSYKKLFEIIVGLLEKEQKGQNSQNSYDLITNSPSAMKDIINQHFENISSLYRESSNVDMEFLSNLINLYYIGDQIYTPVMDFIKKKLDVKDDYYKIMKKMLENYIRNLVKYYNGRNSFEDIKKQFLKYKQELFAFEQNKLHDDMLSDLDRLKGGYIRNLQFIENLNLEKFKDFVEFMYVNPRLITNRINSGRIKNKVEDICDVNYLFNLNIGSDIIEEYTKEQRAQINKFFTKIICRKFENYLKERQFNNWFICCDNLEVEDEEYWVFGIRTVPRDFLTYYKSPYFSDNRKEILLNHNAIYLIILNVLNDFKLLFDNSKEGKLDSANFMTSIKKDLDEITSVRVSDEKKVHVFIEYARNLFPYSIFYEKPNLKLERIMQIEKGNEKVNRVATIIQDICNLCNKLYTKTFMDKINNKYLHHGQKFIESLIGVLNKNFLGAMIRIEKRLNSNDLAENREINLLKFAMVENLFKFFKFGNAEFFMKFNCDDFVCDLIVNFYIKNKGKELNLDLLCDCIYEIILVLWGNFVKSANVTNSIKSKYGSLENFLVTMGNMTDINVYLNEASLGDDMKLKDLNSHLFSGDVGEIKLKDVDKYKTQELGFIDNDCKFFEESLKNSSLFDFINSIKICIFDVDSKNSRIEKGKQIYEKEKNSGKVLDYEKEFKKSREFFYQASLVYKLARDESKAETTPKTENTSETENKNKNLKKKKKKK